MWLIISFLSFRWISCKHISNVYLLNEKKTHQTNDSSSHVSKSFKIKCHIFAEFGEKTWWFPRASVVSQFECSKPCCDLYDTDQEARQREAPAAMLRPRQNRTWRPGRASHTDHSRSPPGLTSPFKLLTIMIEWMKERSQWSVHKVWIGMDIISVDQYLTTHHLFTCEWIWYIDDRYRYVNWLKKKKKIRHTWYRFIDGYTDIDTRSLRLYDYRWVIDLLIRHWIWLNVRLYFFLSKSVLT